MKQFLIFELNSSIKKMDFDDIVKGIRTSIINNNRSSLNKLAKVQGCTPVECVLGIEIYLPFRELKRGRYQSKHKDYYINGYGFLEYVESLNYLALEKVDFIETIIKTCDNEMIELLEESVIREEQAKMLDFFSSTFKEGQLVQVVDGDFSNMPARVVGYNESKDEYEVIIATRSNMWDLSIPSMFLEVREEDILVSDDFIDEEN